MYLYPNFTEKRFSIAMRFIVAYSLKLNSPLYPPLTPNYPPATVTHLHDVKLISIFLKRIIINIRKYWCVLEWPHAHFVDSVPIPINPDDLTKI